MNKASEASEAQKIKDYIENTIVVPLEVVEGCRAVIGGTGTSAHKGNTVWTEGGIHIIKGFIHRVGFYDKAIINGSVATAAELGPANGVTEDENSYTYGNLRVHKNTAKACLDEIIAKQAREQDKYLWAQVYYNNGALHLVVNGLLGEWGWARLRGTKVHSYAGDVYVIVGYRDTPEIDIIDMSISPVKEGHIYKYCLLERVS